MSFSQFIDPIMRWTGEKYWLGLQGSAQVAVLTPSNKPDIHNNCLHGATPAGKGFTHRLFRRQAGFFHCLENPGLPDQFFIR